MNRFGWLVLLLSLLLKTAFADVSLYDPSPGTEIRMSSNESAQISVAWLESGTHPRLSQLHNYSMVLCSGPNEKIKPIQTLADEISSKALRKNDYTFNATLSEIKDSGVFFIQVIAKGDKVVTIHYTNRFVVSKNGGKVDTTKADVRSPYPETIFHGKKSQSLTSIKLKTEYYTLPYEAQATIGPIKYASRRAPPQSSALSKRWTAKTKLTTKKRLVFTKVGGYADGKQHFPNVHFTVTQPQLTQAITSPNFKKPAPDPTSWYQPSQRIRKPKMRHYNIE